MAIIVGTPSNARRPAAPPRQELLGALSEQRLEFGEPIRVFVMGGEARRPLELRDDRVKRTIGLIGRAEMADRGVRLACQLLAKGVQQPRLADASLPRDQDHLAVAVLGPAPALQQHGQLVLTSDQRRDALPMESLEAAIGGAFALDHEGGDRLRKALDPGRTEVVSSNKLPTSRRVAWLMTTLLGAAKACSRDARFGVSPTTARS